MTTKYFFGARPERDGEATVFQEFDEPGRSGFDSTAISAEQAFHMESNLKATLKERDAAIDMLADAMHFVDMLDKGTYCMKLAEYTSKFKKRARELLAGMEGE